MAPFGNAKLFFGIFFIVCCFTVTMAEVLVDCCLSVKNRELDKRLFVDYQEQAKSCTLDATILVTRLGKQLCAPTKEENWVQTVMKHVDHLKKICKKLNYKSKRCTGMKPE